MKIPRINPTKNFVKEVVKVIDINVEKHYYFTDKLLKIAYDISIENHHDKHGNSLIPISSKFDNIGIDKNHINKIRQEMSHVYAKIFNQNKFKHQLTFLVLFNKYEEDNEITSEIETPITLSIIHNLTQTDIDIINIQWDVENRIQSVEMKESGGNFQKNNTMGFSFYKIGNLKVPVLLKFP